MDLPEENVADTDKYAFLLGSALKNEDLDQFFCVYDSILPSDISATQVKPFSIYLLTSSLNYT